jgi:hypothetical protein
MLSDFPVTPDLSVYVTIFDIVPITINADISSSRSLLGKQQTVVACVRTSCAQKMSGGA